MKKYIFFFLLGILILFSTTNIKANVYASAITVTYTGTFPASISYNLNQPATQVIITISDIAGTNVKTITITSGNGVNVGFNDVNWDGSLDGGGSATSGVWAISIKAVDAVGSDGYELISYETSPDSWFWSSSGVASNKNQNSPYFGMAYVTERTGGTSGHPGAILTQKGLYLFDSFGKYYGGQQNSAYAEGNSVIPWATLATDEGAPFGVTIGPDNRVYTFVLSSNRDAVKHGGLAVGDALWTTGSVKTILSFNDQSNHNSISDAIVVGTGADRILYTVEQTSIRTGSDDDSRTDGDGFDTSHVKRYALGNTSGLFTGPGEVVIPSSVMQQPFRIEIDSSGYLYVVQQSYDSLARANNLYGLSKWDISTLPATEMWHVGLNDAPDHFDSAANANNARATNFNGLTLDEPRGIVYITRKDAERPAHNVIAYNMATGALMGSFASGESVVGSVTTNLSGGGGSSIRDVYADAAGNIMIVNSSFEAFRIFSPPDGPNSFTTTSPTKIDIGNGVTDVEEISSGLPTKFSLEQNYPNPFNPSTTINFSISKSEFVTMIIYNALGQEVATVVNEFLNAGSYKVNFNADKLASGMYLYKITAGKFISTKKMLLLK
ncbi:MAG TPA: T9SS type A sorting domain-containing protein [Ignavibacteria bacterium]|nr:T9SS type A sorting domain-containing protein [Ignavibacteria bacterium]